MNAVTSVTSIPVEWLFGSIAALISIIYVDLKNAVRSNDNAGKKRDLYLVRICEKLGIDFKL
jgi:hypothetical protein